MKVVIDTNIIVSGLITPFGHSAEILRLLAAGKILICLDARILVEYFEVLKRPKFNFNKDDISILLKEIELTGEFSTSIPIKKSLPDPNDNMFLEVALPGNAECIITGNSNHFPAKLCSDVKIFSPAKFINYFIEKSI
jgi:putative PIN family toxin of toxin-antitoxin system